MNPWWWIVLPAFALGVSLFNLFTWPRGRSRPSRRGISVLIPARNEERNLPRTLAALHQLQGPVEAIWVYDDASTDRTPEILAEWQQQEPRLRVVRGDGLPRGWIGKTHACHRLAERAESEGLLFLDADVTVEPELLERLGGLIDDYRADVVTAVPAQQTGSFFEGLVLPLLHLTYTSWLPLPLIWWSPNPKFLAANGQLLYVGREAYRQLGGFEAVRSELVDDMAFCRRAKEAGLKVVFADGSRLASCRMYQSRAEVIAGFSKNLYEGVGGQAWGLLAVLALYALAFVAPYVGLLMSVWIPEWRVPAGLAVGLNLVLRSLLAWRYAHRAWSVVLHPLGVLALIGIGLNSWWWQRRGRVEWRGRSYAARRVRTAPEGGAS